MSSIQLNSLSFKERAGERMGLSKFHETHPHTLHPHLWSVYACDINEEVVE
jgi:hypothetical protein